MRDLPTLTMIPDSHYTIYFVEPDHLVIGVMASGMQRMAISKVPQWLKDHPGAMITRMDPA